MKDSTVTPILVDPGLFFRKVAYYLVSTKGYSSETDSEVIHLMECLVNSACFAEDKPNLEQLWENILEDIERIGK